MNADPTKPTPDVPGSERAEPTAGSAAAPLWLIILFGVLFYWGQLYVDANGGGFNSQVYEPYHSFDQVKDLQPKGDAEVFVAKGKLIYGNYCTVCHTDSGIGNPITGCPPLVESEWVVAPGPGRLVRLVSKGLLGPIEVKGQVYSTGTMLAIGDQLPGDEKEKAESIAAVISYIRASFGNKAPPIKPEQVQAIREKIKDRSTSFTPDELKAISVDE